MCNHVESECYLLLLIIYLINFNYLLSDHFLGSGVPLLAFPEEQITNGKRGLLKFKYALSNKLMSVFYVSVLLLIMNFVITLIHEVIVEWIHRLLRQCYAEIHCQY